MDKHAIRAKALEIAALILGQYKKAPALDTLREDPRNKQNANKILTQYRLLADYVEQDIREDRGY
jgi:hypothetical protein